VNLHDFFKEAAQLQLKVSLPNPREPIPHALSNEALFQLPLLAMVILSISKGKSKPELPEIGQLVGECLERTVAGFKGSSQDIGWSANLRIRTIKALTFLEASGLAEVEARTKLVKATEMGRQVYDRAVEDEGYLSYALQTVERSYQNIRAETKIKGEVN
jgi:hypothetical protein